MQATELPGGDSLLAVGFSPAPALAELAAELGWRHPFLSDPERLLYSRLRLPRASRRDVYNRSTLALYARALRQGRRVHRPVEDVRQLGGDAIVRDGRAVRVFRPAHPDERPPVAELLAALGAAR